MALAAWGLSGVAMVGPRPYARIAALTPQMEVTLLFLVGLPVWSQLLRAARPEALRRSLAVTRRGRQEAVLSPAWHHLKTVAAMVGAGAFVWIVASASGGLSLPVVGATRLLLVAFAVFGIGLGVWASVVCRSSSAALGASAGILLAMAVSPLAVAPLISTLGARRELIEASMLLNPWLVTAGLSGLDLLRMQWVYALSPLGSLEAAYPRLALAVLAYAGAGMLLLGASVRQLRPHAARTRG
jgi:hypothetical protein